MIWYEHLLTTEVDLCD